MLRRKLLIILGPLVTLLAITLIIAIVLLQQVLGRIDHLSTFSWRVVDQVSLVSNTMTQVEIELNEVRMDRTRPLDRLIDSFQKLDADTDRLGEFYVMHESDIEKTYQLVHGLVKDFSRKMADLCVAQDPQTTITRTQAALEVALQLRRGVLELGQHAAEHGVREQGEMASQFKWLVFGLGVVFLLVLNAAVLTLLWVAGMILKPVDALVKASRELAAEHFDHRIQLDRTDEFGELARAYNHLAEQLQLKEQQRLETLNMAALTLNHELNNAMEAIELQLQLLGRRAGESAAISKNLTRIHDGLERMSRTVESLKHIKRIVLTDYVQGTKMLDLQRSTEPEHQHAGS